MLSIQAVRGLFRLHALRLKHSQSITYPETYSDNYQYLKP